MVIIRKLSKDFPVLSDNTVHDLSKKIRKLEHQRKECSNLKEQKSTLIKLVPE